MYEPSVAVARSTRGPDTGGLVTRAFSYSRSRHPALRATSLNVFPGAAARASSRERARPTVPAARKSARTTIAGSRTPSQRLLGAHSVLWADRHGVGVGWPL